MKVLPACVMAVVLAGCGSSNNANPALWVGSWTASGTEVESCPSGNNTAQLTGTVNIDSFASNEVTTMAANGCNLDWTLNGNAATLTGSTQVCTVPGSLGGTWHATYTSGTLSLSGNTISVGDMGTAVLAINNTTANCTFTQSGLLTHN